MRVLLTGGAGYIGSQIILSLIETGYEPIIIDNLSNGSKQNLPKDTVLYEADIADESLVKTIIKDNKIESVIHLAAFTSVEESMTKITKYYDNNVIKSMKFLKACGESNIKNIIFSSTAACYGIHKEKAQQVNESSMLMPINVYGKTKLIIEMAIKDLASYYNFKYAIFRFFNVAGADSMLRTGSMSKKNEHIVAKSCEYALGIIDNFKVYGDNYNTRDGTCIRDYIHVMDIADAHVKAIRYLNKNNSFISNLGYGKGYSVFEVLEALQKILGKKLKFEVTNRREGDVDVLIADNNFAVKNLNWKPNFDNINSIIRHQLLWTKKLYKISEI